MDIPRSISEEEIIKKKRNDWCKALSFYSSEQKICGNCLSQKSQLTNFVLPLEKAYKKLENVDLQAFETAMSQAGKPIIYSYNNNFSPNTFLIYYTHGINFDGLGASLPFTNIGSKPSAIIVSPEYHSKSKRTDEAKIVRETQKYFNPTGFIKLPLYEIDELITYAASEKCETLLLPYNKMVDYLKLVIAHPTKNILPAVFYPIKHH